MGADFFARSQRHPNRTRYVRSLEASGSGPGVAPAAPQVSVDTLSAPAGAEPVGSLAVAVLCPGPSLAKTWVDARDFPRFALVVAVNDAAWRFRCHWLAFSDKHIIVPIWAGAHRLPLTGLLTNKAFGPQGQARGLQWIRPDTFNDRADAKGTSYSMVSAVWFAQREAKRLATHVEIFGYDAVGAPTIGGIDKAGSHRNARWASEARFMRPLWSQSIVTHGQAAQGLLKFLRGEARDIVW